MSNKALDAARRKGREAREAGKSEDACPYGDERTHYGGVTFSRAFIRAWLDGYRSSDNK